MVAEVGRATVRRTAVHEHDTAPLHGHGNGCCIGGNGIGANTRAAVARLVREQAEFVNTGQNLHAAVLHSRVHQRRPAGHDVGVVGLLPRNGDVLMPRDVVEVVSGSGGRGGRLRAQVLNRVAGDFGCSQKRLHRIQIVRVSQKLEHRPSPRLHDVHAVSDVLVLRVQNRETMEEIGVLGKVGDCSLGVQDAGAGVNPCLVFGNNRREVSVGDDVLHDENAVIMERLKLCGRECHSWPIGCCSGMLAAENELHATAKANLSS